MEDIRKNDFFSEHRVVIYIAVIVFEVIFLLFSNVNSFHTDVAICVNLFIFSFFTALALLVEWLGDRKGIQSLQFCFTKSSHCFGGCDCVMRYYRLLITNH